MRLLSRIMQLVSALVALCAACAAPCSAQHPIDVQRLVASGEYFEALHVYDKMPQRKTTTDATIAAGKAAWALSLPGRAIDEFDRALHDEQLDAAQRARLLLSRGIIEYQEDRHRVALLFAEKVINVLTQPSALRGKAWLLWGEALSRLRSYGAAEDKYRKALEETPDNEQPAVYYVLGLAQYRLGKLKDARASFEKVPLEHEYTAQSMRRLAELSLAERKYDEAAFWLARGRHDYPDSFLDSWADYALLQVAVHNDNPAEVDSIREKAQKKYPPSDAWLSLLNAAAEEYRWRAARGAAQEAAR